jgi:hypothetical protein
MEAKEKQEGKEQDLERMTVKELRTLAAESTDLVGVHAMKKAELLAGIKEEKGIKEEEGIKEEKGIKEEEGIKEEKAPKRRIEEGGITVKQLKVKIVELKRKRQEAREAKDKRMVNILRRTRNRVKKRTRKFSHA